MLNLNQMHRALRRAILERWTGRDITEFSVAMSSITLRARVARQMAVAAVRAGAPVEQVQAELNHQIDLLEQELKVLLA